MNSTNPRDNEWLQDLLAEIWYRYFRDVPQNNDVVIKFGQKAKTRLGSIKWGRKLVPNYNGSIQKRSIITVSGYFRDPTIPQEVAMSVIAHELVHYTHGFSSPNPQLHKHPHKGGVVDKEMKRRGLAKILEFEKQWMKKHWRGYLRING